MIPGMNPRKAAQMMRKLGIQQQEIDAEEVIIKTADKELIIRNPQVSKVNVMGQETIQIIGDIEEHKRKPKINEEDISTVMQQTGCSKEDAIEAIKNNDYNLAAAILALQKE
ncbi:nascent polypeptide-associated complex protein [Candidatus Woesearchaeota archaeon]|nr:MAG: nascent polypeptide-associated complex protein [Candidatus Woesearchaeota archaeon]